MMMIDHDIDYDDDDNDIDDDDDDIDDDDDSSSMVSTPVPACCGSPSWTSAATCTRCMTAS
jgi:hypothetical protein